MGGVAKTVKKIAPIVSPVTYFASKAALGGAKGAAQSVGFGGGGTQDSTLQGGAFSISPEQLEAEKLAIENLGRSQYDKNLQFVEKDQSTRASARDALAQALTRQAQSSFQSSLPDTLEDLNSRNLLNSSGVGQEIARQQNKIATDIANQVGVIGAQDIDLASQQRAAALAGLQGTETSGLQRQFSLEDFIRQANVAKSIGAQMAPQSPSGKAGALSGGVSGLAAGAPLGLPGAALGGLGGIILGSQINKRGK